ncbi:PIG-L family deacetylase [Photobacterium sp. 2_MG-2023]|uniref:PIG-L family deacetylase n=1 Tax=Photobacterium arenosum TaxID=2774143 RepID=A0ABR9BMD8_9GAMM|nr:MULTISPECIES: PIG-L family deacetylase [Photobacterium]MBD8513730.1 PIG-L family deacetylase [Photobacterium arenosum]MDO6582524.1 PIG-L family deacetylase [Photobacterium sp. 2_MG-2023]
MRFNTNSLVAGLLATASCMAPAVQAAPLDVNQHNLYFLSPHPDDILLTFGGLINKLSKEGTLAQKTNVTEVYFSLSNYTTNHLNELTNKRVFDVSTMRYKEDFEAHMKMFTQWDHFRYKTAGFYDAPLRKYEGSPTAGGGPAGTFTDFRQDEIGIYERIAADVTPILKQDNCAAFVLLANGSHIDHFIVREAVMKAAHDLGAEAKCQIYFGEDQPYTGSNPDNAMDEVNSIQARLPANSITPMTFWIDKQHKIDAFKEFYLSQYDLGYIPPLESTDYETIYKWDKTTYSALQPHAHCQSAYCNLQ